MLHEMIKNKYGSVDKMIEQNGNLPARSHIYRIINKESKPTLVIIFRLANALGIEVKELIDALEVTDEDKLD